MTASAQNLQPYERWRTSYPSDGRELAGFWLVPDGDGPFPAAVFNHGSDGLLPGSMSGVLALRDMGYATFLPVRRGHNEQPGTFWLDQVTANWGTAEMGDQLVSALRALMLTRLAVTVRMFLTRWLISPASALCSSSAFLSRWPRLRSRVRASSSARRNKGIFPTPSLLVEWPRGEATACKAVHTGSIPVSTSKRFAPRD